MDLLRKKCIQHLHLQSFSLLFPLLMGFLLYIVYPFVRTTLLRIWLFFGARNRCLQIARIRRQLKHFHFEFFHLEVEHVKWP